MQPILSNLLIDVYINDIHKILDIDEVLLSKQLEYKFVKIYLDDATKFLFKFENNTNVVIVINDINTHIFGALYNDMKMYEISTYYGFDLYLIEDCTNNLKALPYINLSTYVSELVEKYELKIDLDKIIYEII